MSGVSLGAYRMRVNRIVELTISTYSDAQPFEGHDEDYVHNNLVCFKISVCVNIVTLGLDNLFIGYLEISWKDLCYVKTL